MIEAGIVSLLRADSQLSALLAGRIFAVVLPPETETFPALTYQVVSGASDWSLDRSKFDEKRIQFDAWGVRYGDCKAVLKQLGIILDGFSGALPDGTRVISAFSGVTIDNFESDGRIYRSLTEFIFQFVEA